MSFSHLKIKITLRKKAIREFEKSSAKNKEFGSFKSGYNMGFNDAINWLIKKYKVKDVADLKSLSYVLDSKFRTVLFNDRNYHLRKRRNQEKSSQKTGEKLKNG